MRRLGLLAAVVMGLASTTGASPQADKAAHAKASAAPIEAAFALKQDMRKLWTDHVVWTRNYIIAAVGDQPDAKVAADRLMRNQEDIGKAVAKFYGDAAGQQMTTLLKEHITIAVDLIKAAKAGDKAGQQKADSRWQQNAVQIADFLSKANPNWPRATLVDLMKGHLSTTTDEVVARLNKNWDADVRAFDAVYAHILKMSDALADGIVKQFPDKFGPRPIGTSGVR
jgi:type VI protein secretion system component VasK